MASKQVIGELVWKITGDNSNVNKKLGETENKAKSFGSKFSGALKAISFVAVAAGVTKISKALISAASDAEEAQNAVNVTFKEGADAVNEYAKIASTSVGLSSNKFKELSTVIGAQLKQTGLPLKRVADDTINLTERAADLASVFNTEVSEATTALGAALRGESEPARRFGINISDAAIQAEALATGLVSSKKEITDQIKVQARLSLIYKQSADVAGDFKNTSDGLANSSRILKARFEDLQAKLGKNLLPIASKAVTTLNKLVGSNDDLEDSTGDLIGTYDRWQDALKKTTTNVKGLTDEQKALNNVQALQAEAEFYDNIININKGYEKQVKEIEKLEKKSKSYSDAVIRSTFSLASAEDAGRKKAEVDIETGLIYKKLETKTLSLTKARKFLANTELEGIRAGTEAKIKNAELEKSITNLALAQIRKSDVDILGLIESEKLRESVEKRIESIRSGLFVIDEQNEKEKETTEVLSEETDKRITLTDKEIEARKRLANVVANTYADMTDALFDFSKGAKETSKEMLKAVTNAIAAEIRMRGIALFAASIFPPNAAGIAGGVGMITASQVIKGLGQVAVNSYDVGTARVDRDQQAIVHKDEIILPKGISDTAREEGISIAPTGGSKSKPIMIQFMTEAKEVFYEKMYSDSEAGLVNLSDISIVRT